MTIQQAHKQAVQMFGKKAIVTENPKALSKEERAAIMAKPKEQRTKDEQSSLIGRRCSIGVVVSLGGLISFNEVQGWGDTWEEAFQYIADRKARAAQQEADRHAAKMVEIKAEQEKKDKKWARFEKTALKHEMQARDGGVRWTCSCPSCLAIRSRALRS